MIAFASQFEPRRPVTLKDFDDLAAAMDKIQSHYPQGWKPEPPMTQQELHELGWEEALEGIVLVEWPDRLGALAPADALRITLEPGHEEDARTARLSGWDDRLKDLAA